ncbi:hypothetical protein Bbelb_387290 [Branchiostoma belcheri]|nr:hypothetical protein Bbelb_387290 [Branchiostoma belcheri]
MVVLWGDARRQTCCSVWGGHSPPVVRAGDSSLFPALGGFLWQNHFGLTQYILNLTLCANLACQLGHKGNKTEPSGPVTSKGKTSERKNSPGTETMVQRSCLNPRANQRWRNARGLEIQIRRRQPCVYSGKEERQLTPGTAEDTARLIVQQMSTASILDLEEGGESLTITTGREAVAPNPAFFTQRWKHARKEKHSQEPFPLSDLP